MLGPDQYMLGGVKGTGDFVITGGRIAGPTRVLDDGWVAVTGGLISEVGQGAPPEGPRMDVAGALVVPGFVDTHCHGGGGGSFSSGDPDELALAVRAHRGHGTTTMLASLVSDPVHALCDQIAALRELVQDGEVHGIHLEGPFISHARCGAHDPAALLEPDTATVSTLLNAGRGDIRMVTLAPELHGGVKAVRQLTESGVIAALGHTDGVQEQILPAIDAGATVATHLFNGMRPLHHREPGPVGVLLDDERITVELICDLVHIHPTVVHLAAKHAGKRRTVLITDAMSATDAADGAYRLGRLKVNVSDDFGRYRRARRQHAHHGRSVPQHGARREAGHPGRGARDFGETGRTARHRRPHRLAARGPRGGHRGARRRPAPGQGAAPG